MKYLFVYGTLLYGEPNNNYLGTQAQFICKTSIRAKMFSAGAFPYIMFSNSSKDRVHGELYLLPYKQIIHNIDHLEGYKPNNINCLYFRKKTTTASGHHPFVYVAGNFIHSKKQGPHITSGDWKQFKLETITKNAEPSINNHIRQIRSFLPTEKELVSRGIIEKPNTIETETNLETFLFKNKLSI